MGGLRARLRHRLCARNERLVRRLLMLAAFIGALREGREPPIPFDETVAVTMASFTAAESIRTGQPARI